MPRAPSVYRTHRTIPSVCSALRPLTRLCPRWLAEASPVWRSTASLDTRTVARASGYHTIHHLHVQCHRARAQVGGGSELVAVAQGLLWNMGLSVDFLGSTTYLERSTYDLKTIRARLTTRNEQGYNTTLGSKGVRRNLRPSSAP